MEVETNNRAIALAAACHSRRSPRDDRWFPGSRRFQDVQMLLKSQSFCRRPAGPNCRPCECCPAALRGGPVCRYRARVGLCLPSLPAGTALSRCHVPATNRLPPLPASTAFTPHRAFCAPGPAAPRRARRLQCGGQYVIIEQNVWMTRKYWGFEGEIDRPWGSGLLGGRAAGWHCY